MDLVAGTVAASPCPPLPLLINRTDTKTGKDVPGFASSHHILMEAMTHAMARDNPKENKIREIRQTELTNILLAEFCNKLNTPLKLYDACTTFTRNYLHSFIPHRTVPDARFAHYEDVSCDTYTKNHMVRSCCEHLAGLIFYDKGGEIEYDDILEPFKNMPFSQILQEYAKVHTSRSLEIPSIIEVDE
jgi:hypothetical protein